MYKEWLNATLSTKTDLNTLNPLALFSSKLFNKEGLSKFKNLKSDDLQLLSSERNPRLLGNYNSNTHTHNFTKYGNNQESITSNLQNLNTGQDQYNVYGLSQLNWPNLEHTSKVLNNVVWMPTAHAPIMSSNPNFHNTSYDFFEKNEDDLTPNMLRSKDESAPNHVFNTY